MWKVQKRGTGRKEKEKSHFSPRWVRFTQTAPPLPFFPSRAWQWGIRNFVLFSNVKWDRRGERGKFALTNCASEEFFRSLLLVLTFLLCCVCVICNSIDKRRYLIKNRDVCVVANSPWLLFDFCLIFSIIADNLLYGRRFDLIIRWDYHQINLGWWWHSLEFYFHTWMRRLIVSQFWYQFDSQESFLLA